MVGFATLATVIASQAIISGAFSLTQQSIQLGFLPRMHIRHTASDEIGQIYIAGINWLLAAATIAAVLIFRSSDALAGAYGLAVSLLMAITTFLAALVALQWGYNLALVLAVNGLFFAVDLVFFAANGIKLFEGGWFPLILSAVVAFLMLTWRRGQLILEERRALLAPARGRPDPHAGARRSPPSARHGGIPHQIATHGVPLPLTHFMRHTHALQERVLSAHRDHHRNPPRAAREALGGHRSRRRASSRVILRYGFIESSTTLVEDVQARGRSTAGSGAATPKPSPTFSAAKP